MNRKAWEYKILIVDNEPYLQEKITSYGLDGWELITIKYIKKAGKYQLFFKREII